MHELSIAAALLEAARRAVPPLPAGARVTGVTVVAGPLRGLAPEAMEWAWQSAVAGSDWEGVTLELKLLPWKLRCPDCGREFEAGELFAPCACGSVRAHPVGGDELQITALTIDEPDSPGSAP